mmetsp:Transcript_57619/g.137239  ORF Transcript_57619/g.137239 Transcript_57619/m.137239 type:complete len:254 (+) Transcript_57619:3438-4199(+)
MQLHGTIESRLTAKGCKNPVWLLTLDHFNHEVRCHWQKIDPVSHAGRCLNCSDVRVDEDGHDTGLFQGFDGLAARVVKLTCLTDGEATRSQHQHLPVDRRNGVRHRGYRGSGRLSNELQEVVKQKVSVGRPTACLRMELHREPWPGGVDDAFVCAVVGVHHQRHPVLWQAGAVNGIPMILGCDVALLCAQIHDWLVHSAVPELHLVGGCSRGQGQNLIPEADSEDGCLWPLPHDGLHMLHGFGTLGGISWSVA